MIARLALAVGSSVVLCQGAAGASPQPVPAFGHAIVIVLENKEYSDVLGSSEAPASATLSRRYAQLTRYYGVSHPSLPNYLALVSGSTHAITSDCTDCTVTGRTSPTRSKRPGKPGRRMRKGCHGPGTPAPSLDATRRSTTRSSTSGMCPKATPGSSASSRSPASRATTAPARCPTSRSSCRTSATTCTTARLQRATAGWAASCDRCCGVHGPIGSRSSWSSTRVPPTLTAGGTFRTRPRALRPPARRHIGDPRPLQLAAHDRRRVGAAAAGTLADCGSDHRYLALATRSGRFQKISTMVWRWTPSLPKHGLEQTRVPAPRALPDRC